MKKDLFDGSPAVEVFGPGVKAGPDADGDSIVWQATDMKVCRRELAGGPDRCLASPTKLNDLALSGNLAISEGGTSMIRVFDFEAMSSRAIDQSTMSGWRYDPDIEGSQAVYVKERGWAGRYYEPLVTLYNVDTDITTYLSKPGGGTAPGGASKYGRRNPVISGDRVLYQERYNMPQQGWDIKQTSVGTEGTTVVDAVGDQINPSLSGDIVVYQDNRTGYWNEAGAWVGEWNIYMKDLSTGVEQPVCTAAGDQINPVIKGDRIVWEDYRNGDWDIYAATLFPAEGDADLMQMYAPRLVMHGDEQFRPMEAGGMVASPGTTLMAGGIERLRAPDNLTLDAIGSFGADSNIDLPGACIICGPHPPDYAFDRYIYTQYVRPYNRLASDGVDERIYGRVVHPGDRTVIQYWLNYYFNDHPMISHEGDWELIEVELDEAGEPARVSVSQHAYGRKRIWRDVEKRDGHPVIYVARGSHANYFEPREHAIELEGLPNPVAVDETADIEAGKLIEPEVLPLPGTAFDIQGYKWLNFAGHWGELNGNPNGDSPVGPAWTGQRWSKPFAWQGLEWDGFSGVRGMLIGLQAEVGDLVEIDLFDALGRHTGLNPAGEPEAAIPGSNYLAAAESGKKTVSAAYGENGEYRLQFSAGAAVHTPIRLSWADPGQGMLATLAYHDVYLEPGAAAALTVKQGGDPSGFDLLLDRNGDGEPEETIQPDELTQATTDLTSPAAVTDLVVTRGVSGQAKLGWTAPGDDGASGQAAAYAVRYSSEPITAGNWSDAEPVAVAAPPQAAGSAETLEITDLPDGKLYFAIRTTDEAGNGSGLSSPAMSVIGRPSLSLALESATWSSYAAYLDRQLSVGYRIENRGRGDARNVMVRQAIASPAAVCLVGAYPELADRIAAGGAFSFDLKFQVPPGVGSFMTSLSASCADVEGAEMWFGAPAG